MKFRTAFILTLIALYPISALLYGCEKRGEKTLLLNRRADLLQARGSCAGQSETCISLAIGEVSSYESEFVTEFAAYSPCNGLTLVLSPESYGAVDAKEPQTKWRFDVSRLEHTDVSDDPVFHWTLFHGSAFTNDKDYRIFEGDYLDAKHNAAASAVHRICEIMQGGGGRIQ